MYLPLENILNNELEDLTYSVSQQEFFFGGGGGGDTF